MPPWSKEISRSFLKDTQATAAIEFAGAALLLLFGIMNAVDLGSYAFRRMEVENAAQVGGQMAWKTCYDQSSMLPATQNCPGLNSALASAIQSTSLGTAIKLSSGYPKEADYCVTASNLLQAVGSLSAKPADCSSVGSASTSPGDYIQIGVTYAYSPIFSISVMGASGISSIAKITWMRLG